MVAVHPAIQLHLALLEKWRSHMDLVGPGPLLPHVEDAVAAVDGLEARGRWADLGSGAGFPGLALAALHPEALVDLVERRERRVAFLSELLRVVALPNARLLAMDSAELEPGYDGIISRAYKPPAEVLADARRLLRPGGRVVLLLAREDPPTAEDFRECHVKRYEIDGRPRRVVALRLEPR